MEIKEQIANEIHKPIRKKFARRKVIVKSIDDLWQCDLIDMIKYSKFNNGFKYLLTVIDVFSKYAWVEPVKTKSGKNICNAMEKIINKGRVPKNLQSDLGSEFYNEDFQKLMKKYTINHYSTYSNLKASVVERFNRTLKNIMWKQFTINGSYSWTKMLGNLVKSYNGRKHSTIKMRPSEVNKKSEADLLRTVYAYKKPSLKKNNRFEMGDYVRISKNKGVFDKGFTPNYSTEIFKVDKVQHTDPVTYLLVDGDNNSIAGGFYEQELVKAKYHDVYLVEKIIRKNKDLVLVKWLGFPSSKNSWIHKDSIV